MAEKRFAAFYVKVPSSETGCHNVLKKITEVENHVGYLRIFFQLAVSITTGPVPEKVNMGPYGKPTLVPLFLAGTVYFA